jgi:DNA helicase II / ATP-dependent DNA helicase PcrA
VKLYRIHGPPGTGKTTKLASWVADAAAKHGSGSILVSSFTRAAAREIASRDLPVDPDQIGTLHALCYRALGRPELAQKHLGDWNEEQPVWALETESPSDLDESNDQSSRRADGDKLMSTSLRMRALMIQPQYWPDDARAFHEKWTEWKRRSGLVDFTDLIEQALESIPRAPGQPTIGFFDEAQDLSPLELALVHRWAENMDYVVIAGDADQAIYGWKGATPRGFLEPAIPDDHNRVLEQSYRVPRAVHSLATQWIEQSNYRYSTVYRPRDDNGSAEPSNSRYSYPAETINLCQRASSEGRTSMVLASCAYMLGTTVRLLREAGVPFHNPWRKKNGAWNPMRGGSERLAAFLVADVGSEIGTHRARLWTWSELWKWAEIVEANSTFKHGAKALIQARAADERREKKAEQLQPVDLVSILTKDALTSLRQAMLANAATKWLRERALPSRVRDILYPIAIVRELGPGALASRPLVTVGSIHSVKGGEAAEVHLFPDLSPSGMAEWSQDNEGEDAVRRLFYVAMTRAKHSVHICQPASAHSLKLIP